MGAWVHILFEIGMLQESIIIQFPGRRSTFRYETHFIAFRTQAECRAQDGFEIICYRWCFFPESVPPIWAFTNEREGRICNLVLAILPADPRNELAETLLSLKRYMIP